jgi:antitoxin VapB
MCWSKPRRVDANILLFGRSGLTAYATPYATNALPERLVRLFRNGRNQAVRIPREFELPGDDALMRKDDDRLIIEPIAPRSLLAVLATLAPIEDDFLAIDDPSPDPVAR